MTFSTSPFNQTSIGGGGSLTVAEGVGADGIGTEGVGFRTISVTRSVTGAAASVDYATSDGTASSTSDYTAALGTLSFAPGEATKSFTVFVTDAPFLEPDQTVNINLSNPVGTTLPAAATAVLVITSNDATSGPSPVRAQSFNTRFFVRQHYLDFLGREPDAGGMGFWTNGIDLCGADAQCLQNKRVDTSAAFFLSIEFQETGFLVQRIYRTAYANIPGTPFAVSFDDFLADSHRIAEGVQVGVGDWAARLESNKQAFALEFVARTRFRNAYPATLTPEQFVGKLDEHAGDVLSQAERDRLVAELSSNNTDAGRASVLRKVAEDAELVAAEFRKAFVQMQYFSYLRRDADIPGYLFWLGKLDEHNGDFRRAQMVQAFITSIEYRERFGQP